MDGLHRAPQSPPPRRVIAAAFRPAPAADPLLVLWGTPQPAGAHPAVRQRIEAALNALGESPSAYSEPDIIIQTATEVLVIEAKFRSPNDNLPADSPRWTRYLASDAFRDATSVRNSGRYELARNWRIGCELAGPRRFALINLAPQRTLQKDRQALDGFESGLALSVNRRFLRLTWSHLLDMYPDSPDWLATYCQSRRLID